MNVTVKSPHMEVTDSIREFVEGKVAKLPKYYDMIQSVDVILDMEADQAVVEIVVSAKRRNTFVATHRAEDLYASVDQCLHKITEQLRRHKDRVRDRQGPSHSELSGGGL
ncbi:MAG: Ribosome hibernation promoting factor [Planctomycetes bacterium ADurb.Bin126]|nr:MAG: Ribosome hibernation promoting factor [Planctomycetes bacterium ADurb.Bin126]HOD82896.1 ribosome-associated translation inhibitor RaiA [Phycisphaerae bacterium]HQL73748.1 ribosome-associated translation inhibitor RaiA [Phycisphaerae bacterium]